MASDSIFWTLLMKFCIALLLVVINSIIIHYIIVRRNLKDHSFDNPTSIAVVFSVLLIIVSYLPRLKLPFFIITNSLIPLALIKEFYNIEWEEAAKVWGLWALCMILIAAVGAMLVIIIL